MYLCIYFLLAIFFALVAGMFDVLCPATKRRGVYSETLAMGCQGHPGPCPPQHLHPPPAAKAHAGVLKGRYGPYPKGLHWTAVRQRHNWYNRATGVAYGHWYNRGKFLVTCFFSC